MTTLNFSTAFFISAYVLSSIQVVHAEEPFQQTNQSCSVVAASIVSAAEDYFDGVPLERARLETDKEDNADKVYRQIPEVGVGKTLLSAMLHYNNCVKPFYKEPATSDMDAAYKSCSSKNAIMAGILYKMKEGKNPKSGLPEKYHVIADELINEEDWDEAVLTAARSVKRCIWDATSGEKGDHVDLEQFAKDAVADMTPNLPIQLNQNMFIRSAIAIRKEIIYFAQLTYNEADLAEVYSSSGTSLDDGKTYLETFTKNAACSNEMTEAFIGLNGKLTIVYQFLDGTEFVRYTIDSCEEN